MINNLWKNASLRFCRLRVDVATRIVEIRTDCRQTITVRSFVKKLNSLTEVRQMTRRPPPDSTCELRSAIQLDGQYELWNGVLRPKYINSGVLTITDLWSVNEPRTVNPVNFTVKLYNLEFSSSDHRQQRFELYTF